MSGSFQQTLIIGNLGRDPEIRSFQDGKKVCNLRVATSKSWKDRATGEKKERTEWHQVSIYQEGGVRFMEQYAAKGTKVLVIGELETRKWQDQSGQDRYTTEITVRPYTGQIQILTGWRDDGQDGHGNYDQSPPPGSSSRDDGPGGNPTRDLDDEIPF